MKQNAKTQVQTESDEKQQGEKSPEQAQHTSAPDLAALSQTDVRDLSREDILTLQQTYGNRAVARLLEQQGQNGGRIDGSLIQRQGEEEEEAPVPGPRSAPAREDVLDYPGPRSAAAREAGIQPQVSADRSSAPVQRASPSSSATGAVGDAIDVDGEAMYGWTRVITWRDVARVVNAVIPTASSDEEMPRIVIFSGTHGDELGHLVNDAASRGFVTEDQTTADNVMAENEGVQIEVVDVVTSYGTKDELTSIYGYTDYIRILGWCYSARSYWLGDSITSNWWAEPDAR